MEFRFIAFLYLFSSIVLIQRGAQAQTPSWAWVKTLGGPSGGDYGRAITVNPENGDVYTTGSFSDTIDFDPSSNSVYLEAETKNCFIEKLDSEGQFVWALSFQGGQSEGTDIVFDSSGNGSIYVVGYFFGTVDFDPGTGIYNLSTGESSAVFISRLDLDGNFIWAKALISTYIAEGQEIEINRSGNTNEVYILGSFHGVIDADPGIGIHLLTTTDFNDVFLVKLDTDGQFVWARSFGGPDVDKADAIALNAKGDVYISGTFKKTADFDPDTLSAYPLTSKGQTDIFILKLNSSGEFEWVKSVGGISIEKSNSIFIDTYGDGSIYLTGHFFGSADFDPDPVDTAFFSSNGDGDMFISRMDEEGRYIWTNTLGGPEHDVGWDLTVDPDGSGDLYVCGQWEVSVDFDPGPDYYPLMVEGHATCIFVTRYDRMGNFIWVKTAGDGHGDGAHSISIDHAGNIYIAGSLISNSIAFDSIVVGNSPFGFGHDILIAKITSQDTSSIGHLDSITINPNPASFELVINFHETRYYDVRILLYSLLGQVVYSSSHEVISGKKYLEIDHLPAAMYIVELQLDDDRRVKKIVKL